MAESRTIWKHGLAAAVALGCLAAGCTSEETPQSVNPSTVWTPVGTLQGAVYDAWDQMLLAGAKVTISYNGTAVTHATGADGTFSFPGIPATGNGKDPFAATGQYAVTLDLTGVQAGGRTYRPYRTEMVLVGFTAMEDIPEGMSDAVQTPIGGLVASVSFPVHQMRASVAGQVLAAADLRPIKTDLLLVTPASGIGSALPAGAVAAVATSGDDGSYRFAAVEEGLEYVIRPADQAYVIDGNSPYAVGSLIRAAEAGAVTRAATVLLSPRPPVDAQPPYITAFDPTQGQVLPKDALRHSVSFTFDERMNAMHPERAVATFKRLGARSGPDEAPADQVSVAFAAHWDGTQTTLVIEPTADLLPGYRYRITLANGQLADMAGNTRTGMVPSVPAVPDALASAAPGGLDFALSAEAGELTVAAVAQEPDTADNQNPAVQVRALSLASPDNTERSFVGNRNAGFYTLSNSDAAYISWTPPAQPARSYRIWLKTVAADAAPILISAGAGAYAGVAATLDPLPWSRTAYNISLADLNRILLAHPAGIPGLGLANTSWDSRLSLWLGVSVVNADGREGGIQWKQLGDNTAPVLRSGGLGFNATFSPFSANPDAIELRDNAACATLPAAGAGSVPANRVFCPQLAAAHFGNRLATGFGERTLIFELSEAVDPASVVKANVAFVNGSLGTRYGAALPDPNTVGGVTEPDATILEVKPWNVIDGRTKFVAVTVDKFYSVDSGDRIQIFGTGASAGAVKDLAGNAARDQALVSAPFVDRVPAMVKSVRESIADDSIVLTLTKYVRVGPPADTSSGGNITPGAVSFGNLSSHANLRSAVLSTTSSGEQQITLRFEDLGYLRGHNYPAATGCGGDATHGTRVSLTAEVKNADIVDANGAQDAAGASDDGRQAYANLLPDLADAPHSPGAYVPDATSGLGTRSSFRDAIGPRLSVFGTDLDWPKSSNVFTVPAGGQRTITRDVVLTEPTPRAPTGTNPASAEDKTNWSVSVTDLGNDGWDNNSINDGPASSSSPSVATVQMLTTPCTSPAVYRLSILVTNTDTTSAHDFGLRHLQLATTATDLAGNAVSGKNVWRYDPSRQPTGGAGTTGGWTRP